jgi:hypothetical protein
MKTYLHTRFSYKNFLSNQEGLNDPFKNSNFFKKSRAKKRKFTVDNSSYIVWDVLYSIS